MKKPILISGAVLLGFVTMIGWSFELPRLEETVGAYDLLFRGALLGLVLGATIGLLLAVKERSLISKFQSFATALILFTLVVSLLGHFTNRTFPSGEPSIEYMPVKQVTATWKGKGVTRQQLSSPPDGYYIFVETDEGTIRLLQEGRTPPDIGPSRTIEVIKEVGYWGYPRYSISLEDE
ncbi:MAG: hypothetical protein AB8F78_18535 [Saprospiraceae bacterium]